MNKSEKTGSVRGVTTITHRLLYFQEAYGTLVDWSDDQLMSGKRVVVDQFLSEGDGYLRVESAGHTLLVSVEIQAWNGEPPFESADWEISADASLKLRSGFIIAYGLDGETIDEDLAVGDAGTTSNVRIYCRGRRRVRETRDDFDFDEIQEEYLAQFWPASI